MSDIRLSPSGAVAPVRGIAAGTYVGTWDGVALPGAPGYSQKIVTRFRPQTVQCVARISTVAGGGPVDGGRQLAKVDSAAFMPAGRVFAFEPTAFTLTDGIAIGVEIVDDGFVVSGGANAAPGVTQAAGGGDPALPDFFAFEAEG